MPKTIPQIHIRAIDTWDETGATGYTEDKSRSVLKLGFNDQEHVRWAKSDIPTNDTESINESLPYECIIETETGCLDLFIRFGRTAERKPLLFSTLGVSPEDADKTHNVIADLATKRGHDIGLNLNYSPAAAQKIKQHLPEKNNDLPSLALAP